MIFFYTTASPGIDFPNSKYSKTDGLRNPGGKKLVLKSLLRSSNSLSTSFSGSGEGALGRFVLDFCSRPSETKNALLF